MHNVCVLVCVCVCVCVLTFDLHIAFFLRSVGSLVLEVNKLKGSGERRTAVGSGHVTTMPCDLVMQSVGYRSVALHGVRVCVCVCVGGFVHVYVSLLLSLALALSRPRHRANTGAI